VEVELKAEPRSEAGKGPARRLRAVGKIPAVLYGPEVDTQQVSVDERQLWHALHTDAGANVLINLAVDGETYLTLPREIQRDIVRGTLLHVDFLRIRRDVAIQVDVPIHLIGESVGVKEGGVVEHHLWELKVEVLPTDVPESLEADISALAIGDSLHVSDLKVPDDVTVITPLEETLVSVVPPPVLVVEPTPEELEMAEAAAAAEGVEAAEGEEGEAPAAEGEAPAEGEQAAPEEGGEKKGS
jgi:large subunit ribosomal protein L25